MDNAPARNTIPILAVTQLIAWGTLYYAFAILAGVRGTPTLLQMSTAQPEWNTTP